MLAKSKQLCTPPPTKALLAALTFHSHRIHVGRQTGVSKLFEDLRELLRAGGHLNFFHLTIVLHFLPVVGQLDVFRSQKNRVTRFALAPIYRLVAAGRSVGFLVEKRKSQRGNGGGGFVRKIYLKLIY